MVRPKRHSRPGYGSPGESTHNRTSLSNRQHTNRRHTRRAELSNRRQHPHLPHRRSSAPPPPRGTQGFSNLPKDRPGLGETAYTTSEPSLCTNGVLIPNTQVGAGVPSKHRRFYLQTPDSAEYWVACGDRPHNPPKTQITHLSFSGYVNHTISTDLRHHFIQFRI